MSGSLRDRVAIVTGGSQGLGFEIARRYLKAGASVMICARDSSQLEIARRRLVDNVVDTKSIAAIQADVSQADCVAAVVDATLGTFGRLDVLVNNAGVYGPKGPIEDTDWQDWTRAIEINLYGSILMCRGVLPHFKTQKRGKIIQLSGGGATSPMPRLSAYAVSKAAIVRFVESLALEVEPFGIDVNAIAPGALNTRLLTEVLAAGPDQVGEDFYASALRQHNCGGTSLEHGAELAVYLGSHESDGISGKLISAVWDPWKSFAERRADICGTDVYTLRRIVPEDRGMVWKNK